MGPGCWHCEDQTARELLGYISVCWQGPRRPDPRPANFILFLHGDELCDQFVNLSEHEDSYRGLRLRIKSTRKLQRGGFFYYLDPKYSPPIDPLPYLVRLYGPGAEFTLTCGPHMERVLAKDVARPMAEGKAVAHVKP
jgi:hypothetical protein